MQNARPHEVETSALDKLGEYALRSSIADQRPRLTRRPTNEADRIALLMETVLNLRSLVEDARPYLEERPHPATQDATLGDCAHHALWLAEECIDEFGRPKDILGMDDAKEAADQIYAIPTFIIGE